MNKAKKLKQLIEKSKNILIVSHISPDPDALTSVILLTTTLSKNYPDKKITAISEELTGGLKFLKGYNVIKLQPLLTAVEKLKPDLLIILDAMNFERVSRFEPQKVREKIKKLGSKIVIIDHHEKVDIDTNNLYINNGNPATVQEIYDLLFNHLKMKKPQGYQETTLVGLLSDTGGFIYENANHRLTFEIVNQLLEAGASIEKAENRTRRFKLDQLKVFGELANNTEVFKNYTYSYVSDEFTKAWQTARKDPADLKMGCEIFINQFIRNIESNKWGFVVYPELASGPNYFSVSLRSVGDARNVQLIAKVLGGGGHKPAAGAKFKADSIKEALEIVKKAIG